MYEAGMIVLLDRLFTPNLQRLSAVYYSILFPPIVTLFLNLLEPSSFVYLLTTYPCIGSSPRWSACGARVRWIRETIRRRRRGQRRRARALAFARLRRASPVLGWSHPVDGYRHTPTPRCCCYRRCCRHPHALSFCHRMPRQLRSPAATGGEASSPLRTSTVATLTARGG